MLTSGAPATLTTVPGGLTGDTGGLLLSGELQTANTVDQNTLAAGDGASLWSVSQVFPNDTTLTNLSAWFTTTSAQTLVGTTITLETQLYVAPPNGSFSAVPGTECDAAPGLTGAVAVGSSSTCSLTGLAIPIVAGSRGVVIVSASAEGVSLVHSVPVQSAVSIGIA